MLAALLAIAGCGATTSSSTGSSATSTPSAMATSTGAVRTAACNGVNTINQALSNLSTATSSVTVGDVKSAQMKVANAVNNIQMQHPTDPQGLVNQVSTANQKLTEKLAGYPDTTPIGQTSDTVQDVKAKAATAQGKAQQLGTELQCTNGGTPGATPAA
jgi:hypothetical protein